MSNGTDIRDVLGPWLEILSKFLVFVVGRKIVFLMYTFVVFLFSLVYIGRIY